MLGYIRTGTVSRHPVLCVANRQGGACPSTQVLVTLNHGSDAEFYLRSIAAGNSRSQCEATSLL
ncbi:MAG: hypothetical protein GDA43_18435 [Hormoscilla sp. SP5CHS1]|nr:hypothetical protein [Hormoscilla sp. SP12CHS1]MBC6454929.1 hypothetical protein [Hormoscilla sp. SP5CHS1]